MTDSALQAGSNIPTPDSGPKDRWSRTFLESGKVWGDGPSQSGLILIQRVKEMRDRLIEAGVARPNIAVAEAGYGYGRDVLALLKVNKANIQYFGVEASPIGAQLAFEAVKAAGRKSQAWMGTGDFTQASNPYEKNNTDFFLAHRVMHLLGSNGKIRTFLNNVHDLLKPGGEAIISVRDERDFKPDRMELNRDGDAVYKDRPDHVITLWGVDDLVAVFKKAGFEVQEAIQGNEPESTLHPDETTYFTIIRAKKPEPAPAPASA